MTRTRISVYVMIAAIVAVFALSWTLGVSPQLAEAHTNAAEQRTADELNRTQLAKLAALTTDRRNVAALRAQLADADAALPSTLDPTTFLGELNTFQARYHVRVTGYTPSDPQAFGTATDAGTTAAAAPAVAPSASATPAPSASASTAAAVPAAAATPSTSASGLYSVPVQIQVSGSYAELTGFVGALQSGPRLFVVDKLTIDGDPAGSGFTATIGGFVYVLQGASGSAG